MTHKPLSLFIRSSGTQKTIWDRCLNVNSQEFLLYNKDYIQLDEFAFYGSISSNEWANRYRKNSLLIQNEIPRIVGKLQSFENHNCKIIEYTLSNYKSKSSYFEHLKSLQNLTNPTILDLSSNSGIFEDFIGFFPKRDGVEEFNHALPPNRRNQSNSRALFEHKSGQGVAFEGKDRHDDYKENSFWWESLSKIHFQSFFNKYYGINQSQSIYDCLNPEIYKLMASWHYVSANGRPLIIEFEKSLIGTSSYLPSQKKKTVVNRSPHVHKKSQEHFESKIYQRVFVLNPNAENKIPESLFFLQKLIHSKTAGLAIGWKLYSSTFYSSKH